MEKLLAEFRAFNRFYTSIIGILDKHYLKSEFSLTEVRILFEIHYAPDGITAKEITELLKLDKGYLSHMLFEFEQKDLISKERSPTDARSTFIRLTNKGRSVFKPLDLAAREQAREMLGSISVKARKQLLINMNSIRSILSKSI